MSSRRTRSLNKPHMEILEGGRVQIPLTKGKFALIDSGDLRRVIKHSWCHRRGGGNGKQEYAVANVKIDGAWKRVALHRFILEARPGQMVDHQDGDGLNNTRRNLRLATRGQNQHNSGPRTGRFKGVSWSKVMGRWHAQITKDRQYHDLGYYEAEEDAARAYDDAARRLHSDFARLNFPDETPRAEMRAALLPEVTRELSRRRREPRYIEGVTDDGGVVRVGVVGD
jgi:hypothetical protein